MTDRSETDNQAFSLEAFLSVGFRPFYFAGAAFAALSMSIWIGYLLDFISIDGPFEGVLWHSHELVFGFATAILIGFLFTAVKNWTRLPTPSGKVLGGLLLLWFTARLLLLFDTGLVGPIVDLAFLPLATIAVAIPLINSGNRRNYLVISLLVALTLANVVFHAGVYGAPAVDASHVILISIDIFAIFITIIGGRIIPTFTNNATQSDKAQRHKAVEISVIAGMGVLLITDILFGQSETSASILSLLLPLLAVAHIVRLSLWNPQITLIDPILWILPLSYLWLPVSLLLRAASVWDLGVDSLMATHAMTAGAMGSMMLAMMTRSALGHTGRKIKATWVETLIFVLITTGAATRVFGPLILPEYYMMELTISALCWISAFSLYAAGYWRILSRPRS